MNTTNDKGRHVPIGVIEDYLVQGYNGALQVSGNPMAQLIVDAHRQSLALRVPAGARVPNLVEFENLSFDEISDEGRVWHQFAVQLHENLDEVYALLCAILDRVQLSGEPFADAVDGALDSMTGILAVRQVLTRERQIGLFGELWTLLVLAASSGPADALRCWRGASREEHDFGTLDSDLEVKTTAGERREHWISTATQLAPTGDRPLYLLSIQVTTAALDAGHSLPGLVSLARSRVGPDAPQLEAALRALGYRDRDADLYHSRWARRTKPAFYRIGPYFPALTQRRLEEAVPSAERITDLRYRVDLTGLDPSPDLFPVDDI